MSTSVAERVYHQSGLVNWQRCPRWFWLHHVEEVAPDGAAAGFAAPLGVAGHAGCELVLREPDADRQRVLDRMLAAFEEALARGQAQGRSYDPEASERALERLEAEHLELVLALGADPRVRAIEWTDLEVGFRWSDRHGRTFQGTIDAIGRARDYIEGFGVFGRERVDLEPGDEVLVDWKFGRELELSRVGLSLNLQLAYYAAGAARLRPGRRVRTFLGALRDLGSSQRPTDDDGQVIPKTLEELNPEYLAAFAAGRPIDGALRAEADQSRRRFRKGAANLPKRIKRPNPAWEAAQGQPRGPLFHEARIAWDVAGPTIAQTIREIELAARQGGAEAFPARGPITGACRLCPYHRECVAPAGDDADTQ